MKNILLAALLCSSFAVTAQAVRAETSFELWDAMFVARHKSPYDREKAKDIATHIASYCKSEFRLIPSISPREKEWIDKEIDADRVKSVGSTPEYSKMYIRRFADRCIAMTHELMNAENNLLYYTAGLATTLVGADELGWHMENLNKFNISKFSAESISEADQAVHLTGVTLLKSIVVKGLAP